MTYHIRPPVPRGYRLRPVQPLIARDGSCPLVYDLERSLLVEVPDDFRWHAATALETGDLDDELIGWLTGEDVLTWKGRPGTERLAVLSRGAAARRASRCDEVRCRPAEPSVAAVAAGLDALVRRVETGARIVLQLVAEGELARPYGVRRAVATARRAARAAGRSVGFELTTDGRGIGAPFARFLAENRVAVRLACPEEAPALGLLLAHLPERLTFCPVLDSGDRLLDCWRRARALGLRRLAPLKIADRPFAGLAVFEAELRRYRQDLFDVADDLADALASGETPRPVHEPLARVVHRHVAGPTPSAPGAVEEAGPEADGQLGTVGLADCSTCWAADLCDRNVLSRPDPRPYPPRADRCELWRAEVEVGLLLCHRLEGLDPNLPAVLADREEEPVFDAFTLPVEADLLTC